ncbi:Uma2 family endonuclease [Ruania alkalisoli]|uniref:Uma2 family endonuclease n=2 Tax=Ruania alkalisoli TaxID=2779775 RepID=A0A7M1SXX6_9MICO|nr:Uma2 family endonuclease [Ruania alkalisoli]
MTAMTTQAPGLPHGRPLTRADLDALDPDDGHRYELIDGVLIVSPAPRHIHQRALGNLHLVLRAAATDAVEVLFAPFDVALADDTVMQPDLLVAEREAFTARDLPTAPLLAIEVLSPSTRGIDLLLKKDRLERAGCANYWVVDPDEPSVTAWALAEGAFRQVARAIGEEGFEVADPFPIRFTPASLIV